MKVHAGSFRARAESGCARELPDSRKDFKELIVLLIRLS